MAKPKLELTWIGKDARPRLEPRILIEDPSHSHHAPARRAGDIFDNLLIHGDNLLALKALETDPNVRGRVKCIFIDPPYNTGSAFEHYDDGLEHSLWLGMMRDRLELLRNLLAEDGSIWITIDDNEAHYLKVLCDEVFGRSNYLTSIAWNSRKSKQNDAIFTLSHNWVLVYTKDRNLRQINRLPASAEKFENPDNDPRGPWTADPFDAPNLRPNLTYEIVNPNTGTVYLPPTGRCWRTTRAEFDRLFSEGRIVFGKKGTSKPQAKRYLSEATERGEVPGTWWDNEGTATEATKELQELLGREQGFATPKPERLIMKVLTLATNPGDLVLDSFAGSGTTGAVAHKMGRRWIMVELGEHAKTHIVPRLRKVIDGTDKGGITDAAGWKGGGGFRFARLAPSLLERDAWGNWVVSKEYNGPMLAEAMCKHFNYTFAPSLDTYWMHGHASDAAYIYVTTGSITHAQARAISDEVGDTRSLLICCMAYESAAENLPNITMRKIPRVVLDACEWGRDDYSLKISALPMMEDMPDAPPAPKGKAKAADTPDLFGPNSQEGEA